MTDKQQIQLTEWPTNRLKETTNKLPDRNANNPLEIMVIKPSDGRIALRNSQMDKPDGMRNKPSDVMGNKPPTGTFLSYFYYWFFFCREVWQLSEVLMER